MQPWPELRASEATLLDRRRTQRGALTLGDEADVAYHRALATLPPEAAQDARASGVTLGVHVYSRRFFEDTLHGGAATLSASLLQSGAGALRLEHAFHRSARIRFEPMGALADARPPVRAAFAEGVLEGFFGVAFNCAVIVTEDAEGVFHVELGEGRDVNRKARSGRLPA